MRDVARAALSCAARGGLPVAPCIQVRSKIVNQTVALSCQSDIAVSECGYSVFGTRTIDPVIPGWSQRVGALRRPMTGSGPDPESRDSGFASSTRPGMTFQCVDD